MKKSLLISATLATALLPFSGCNPPGQKSAGDAKSAGAGAQAARTYVAPGDKDEYYLFYSGGHSGQVYVAGIPSMRHISTIPVFAPYPATGYGFDEETKGGDAKLLDAAELLAAPKSAKKTKAKPAVCATQKEGDA